MAKLALTERITTENLYQIYSDPYIARIAHDDRPFYPVFHDKAQYLSAWVDNAFAGAFLVIKQSKVEYEIHSLLFKKFLKHSRELGRLCRDWAFSNPIEKITTYVIEGLESARNYCLKLGFQSEGVRRNACVRNGKLCGIHILSMTRGDYGICN